jgi:pyruvate carboxylase
MERLKTLLVANRGEIAVRDASLANTSDWWPRIDKRC